jgi:acyl-CoA synthetase (AMP-forming)/AMP-acid ligase II
LKKDLMIRHIQEKLDYLLTKQWQRLSEMQQMQMELMQENVMHMRTGGGKKVVVKKKIVKKVKAKAGEAASVAPVDDPAKTAEAFNAKGWSTLGDVGRVDDEGYLYLTDRKAFMIISGGVNIYPQEAESVLITHPKVADVAVIGVPNEEFGEEVKAVVQLVDMTLAGPATAQELIAFCRTQLSAVKCPRSIDFDAELPRHPTGKLYKRLIRDRYWAGRTSRIV